MKREYNRLFDKISSEMSDTELLEGALRKVDNMENTNKGRSFKKPLIAIGAAAAALALGVTGAAATGLIDFGQIFGGSVKVDSGLDAADYIAGAEDVVITCSDENYTVSLLGVAGTEKSVIASVELTQMSDNDAPSAGITAEGIGVLPTHVRNRTADGKHRLYMRGSANDDADTGANSESLDGRRISIAGTINGAEWSIEFTYNPAAAATGSVSAKDVSEDAVMWYGDSPFAREGEDGNVAINFDVTNIELWADGGYVEGVLDPTGEGKTLMAFWGNEVKLIKADGTEIGGRVSGYIGGAYGEKADVRFDIEYSEYNTEADTVIVDLTEIAAVSINGTVYEVG